MIKRKFERILLTKEWMGRKSLQFKACDVLEEGSESMKKINGYQQVKFLCVVLKWQTHSINIVCFKKFHKCIIQSMSSNENYGLQLINCPNIYPSI